MRSNRITEWRSWSLLRRAVLLAAVNGLVLALTAAAFELAYRHQVLDTYRPEFRRDNPDPQDATGRPVILVLGDSLSASSQGLAAALRHSVGDRAAVVGAGVSGTTARDALIIAPRRLRRCDPVTTIYQVYAGNDLLETRHPPVGGRASFARRAYWFSIDSGWRSLQFLNYRLGQIRDGWIRRRSVPGDLREDLRRDVDGPWDPTRYSERERRMIAMRPRFIADQTMVTDWADMAWTAYEADLRRLTDLIADANSTVVLVVIPHCTRVSPLYRERFAALGADLPPGVAATPSEFVRRVRRAAAPAVTIDAAPILQAAETGGSPVYRLHDPHLTWEGQRAVADHLARIVLPPDTPPAR
jgi:hypothetical protein